MMKATALALLFLAAVPLALAQDARLAEMVRQNEERIERYRSLPPDLSSRSLFTAAFVFAEAGVRPDLIEFALATGARMQDRDRNSPRFGNFRWDWQDGSVLDANAVEFCMQYGALLHLRHWDRLTPKAQETLGEIFEYAIEGCLRHRVPESYTNIALMNAQNLILLGETLGRPEVLREGKERLSDICHYTWECGIHEYNSPTYYGVNLECLMLLQAFARDAEARQQTDILLDIFWADLAGNWYAPAGKLGGARSRDYDYLRGLGILDSYAYMAGWLPEGTPRVSMPLPALLADWRPDPRFLAMNGQYPRLVEQRYGAGLLDVRTMYATAGVALSVAGSNYGNMDLPFCVDFAHPDRTAIRGYFIPDARRDPYGTKRIPAGGGHDKTLHLSPFWAGIQRRADALGLVVYRDHDYPANPPSLESHFVFPVDLDEIRVGEDVIPLTAGQPFLRELAPGEAVFLRRGQAVAGIRVPWTRSLDGKAAPVALVQDGNSHGAARLTVGHHSFWGLGDTGGKPGAAFWIRVGDGLDDGAQTAWRAAFAASPAEATAADDNIAVQVAGIDGPLALSAAAPFLGCLKVEPEPHGHILAIDGTEHARDRLAALPAIRQRREALDQAGAVTVAAAGATIWEAEAGVVVGGMRIDQDNEAFGGSFVWVPGKPGEKGGRSGARLVCRLDVPAAGTYYLWGRVQTPTPDDDSFFLTITSPASEPVQRADWHLGTHEAWEWTPFGGAKPLPLQLAAGEYQLQLFCREDGAKMDRFLLTADPEFRP
ncbi:MAG: hypothetical protein RBU25_09745 [Lentisphaeria bacterium]|jgi:hypothetical protein|nr:hypothetical protein [Lentisphaeria bacterium]